MQFEEEGLEGLDVGRRRHAEAGRLGDAHRPADPGRHRVRQLHRFGRLAPRAARGPKKHKKEPIQSIRIS